jgi:hypothetical protein
MARGAEDGVCDRAHLRNGGSWHGRHRRQKMAPAGARPGPQGLGADDATIAERQLRSLAVVPLAPKQSSPPRTRRRVTAGDVPRSLPSSRPARSTPGADSGHHAAVKCPAYRVKVITKLPAGPAVAPTGRTGSKGAIGRQNVLIQNDIGFVSATRICGVSTCADSTPVPKVSFITKTGDLGCGVGYYK